MLRLVVLFAFTSIVFSGCVPYTTAKVKYAPLIEVPPNIDVTIVEAHHDVGQKNLSPALGDAVAKTLHRRLGWNVTNGAAMCSDGGHCMDRSAARHTAHFVGVPFTEEHANGPVCLAPAQAALTTWKLAVSVFVNDSRINVRGGNGPSAKREDFTSTVTTFRLWNPQNELVKTQSFVFDSPDDDSPDASASPGYPQFRDALPSIERVNTMFDITVTRRIAVDSVAVGAQYFALLFKTWQPATPRSLVFADDDGGRLEAGNELAADDRFDEAMAAWAKVPTESAALHQNRGVVHLLRGDDAQAVSELRRAKALGTNGVMLFLLREAEARMAYREAHRHPVPGCVSGTPAPLAAH